MAETEGNSLKVESKIEETKRNSDGLRGELLEELENDLPNFSPDTEQLLKFHGIYNQDNRDVRSERKRAGLDLEHICMVRLAIPGGRLLPHQYLAIDKLSDLLSNATLRVTTRQGIQFHFVTKKNVKALVRTVNEVLITTYAGCGDVVRNVTACPSPSKANEILGIWELADAISRRYKPSSSAYYEIWMDGEKIDTNTKEELAATVDPIYGTTYLPRKFKIGVTSATDNCIDVLSCDLALVIDQDYPELIKVFVGGGLGRAHADDTTKALLAKPLTQVQRPELFEVIDGIIAMQRDNGNRSDRSHARFKYLVEEWGTNRIRTELSRRTALDLAPLEPFIFDRSEDHLGWMNHDSDTKAYGIKVPSGRIADTQKGQYRTAIREIVQRFQTEVRFTAKEDVILSGIEAKRSNEIIEILKNYGVPLVEEYTPASRAAFACPALPTCGLALAESERYLPTFLEEFNGLVQDLNLENLEVEIRMTGCPNGCARPYLGEIGIVGRSKRSYDIYLAADRVGNRLGEIYATDIANESLVEALRPVLALYGKEADPAEGFGDFCNRYGIQQLRKFAPEPRRRRVPVE